MESVSRVAKAYFVAGRKISVAAGFTAGAISGAGYALMENLMLFPGTDNWYIIVLVRAGTVAVHTFTAGIVGWAIVKALREHKFALLGAVYLAAVFVHGSWNGLTLLSTVGVLSQQFHLFPVHNGLLSRVSSFASFGLVFIALGTFTGLVLINRRLFRSQEVMEQKLEQGTE